MGRLKFKVRFDYIAEAKSGKFFGSKNTGEQAEEVRQHKVALIRNIPVQGISVDDIDMSQEIYTIIDEFTGKAAYYAPVLIFFTADSLEDTVKFAMKEEFRTIEMIEPEEINLSQMETVKLIQKACEELMNFKQLMERRMNNWK